MTTTNDLRHRIHATDKKGNAVIIDIRLNETGNNGHEDFAITGTIYEKDKPRIDRYCLGGGCIHDTIEEAAPQFLPFIRLHLSDADGVPMHAVANGLYHLQNGFNDVQNTHADFPAKFCKYYRITPDQFAQLSKAHNTIQYALSLEKIGILKQWKAEAVAAIEQLEKMTGKKFKSKATRSNYVRPSKKEITEYNKKVKSGYYSEQQVEQREQQEHQNVIEGLRADLAKTIEKETQETNIKIRVFEIGGEIALKNSIFYNHTQELSFNWNSYEKQVPAETIKAVGVALAQEFPHVTVNIAKEK